MNQRYVNFRWGLTGEAQTMEVCNGRVVSREAAVPSEIANLEGAVDLGGRYILPSFIDAHCHILPTGLDLQKLALDAAHSRDEVLQLVSEYHRSQPNGWLLAVHYNQNRFADGIHLTRDELDAISPTRPILLTHVNGHASLANSAALAAGKVHETTPDPAGGVYHRDATGRLDGLCLERAHEAIQASKPMATVEQMAEAIVGAGERMAEHGIRCASDMMTGVFDLDKELQAYALAAEKGCPIHMRLYLQWRDVFGPRAVEAGRLGELTQSLEASGTLRVRGIKIFSDGGISSATAAIYGRYLSSDPAAAKRLSDGREVDGQLIYSPEKLNRMVLKADDAGWPVSVHAIGDYATDLVLDAMEQTPDPSRHRLEHAMILSDPQIERLQRVGCFLTFQPEFLMALGPAYAKQLGQERASRLIRSRSVLDAGIPLSFNSDRPIVAGNPWDGIRTASNRPAGFVPAENCTLTEAILAYTSGGAAVNGDEGEMGTLLPGSLAHFELYEEDPLVESSLSPVLTRTCHSVQ